MKEQNLEKSKNPSEVGWDLKPGSGDHVVPRTLSAHIWEVRSQAWRRASATYAVVI